MVEKDNVTTESLRIHIHLPLTTSFISTLKSLKALKSLEVVSFNNYDIIHTKLEDSKGDFNLEKLSLVAIDSDSVKFY